MPSYWEFATNSTARLERSQGASREFSAHIGIHFDFLIVVFPFHRASIYPIISRLGADNLAVHLGRFRENEFFKAIGPDNIVLPVAAGPSGKTGGNSPEEVEIWFDWAFIDFWKSNYCKGAFPLSQNVYQ